MVREYDPEDSPYSFGTTQIYNSLFKLLTDPNTGADMFLMNLSVIARNVAGKADMQEQYKSAKEKNQPFDFVASNLAKQSMSEIKRFVSDVVDMFNESKSPLKKYIYLFMSDMKKYIPSSYLKMPSTSKLHIDMAEDILRSHYKQNRFEQTVRGVTIVEIYDYGKIPIFRTISREMKDIKNNHNVLMVSNHPLDYHILDYCNSWSNIKSYTGEIQNKNSLGTKVFGQEYLPFTVKLHILFGDKHDLKPSISGGDKKKLLERAKAESWNLKTTEYVDKAVARLGIVPPYSI